MTRLILVLLVSAPLVAMTSLAQDVAYYRAAEQWQQASPVTYYAHTALVVALGIWLARQHLNRRSI